MPPELEVNLCTSSDVLYRILHEDEHEWTAKLLRVGEVADRVSRSRQSVYRKIESHDLPALRLGEGTASLRIGRIERRRVAAVAPLVRKNPSTGANEVRLYGREANGDAPSATRRICAPHRPFAC
jgi:predicted DNA-binding transcriptional regulator AlpA